MKLIDLSEHPNDWNGDIECWGLDLRQADQYLRRISRMHADRAVHYADLAVHHADKAVRFSNVAVVLGVIGLVLAVGNLALKALVA